MKNIFPLMNQSKLTDWTVKNIFFTGESVKMQITDSISENLTNSDLESSWENYTEFLVQQNTCRDYTILVL